MSTVKKFKFVSPGVKVAEIDRSQVPRVPGAIGPVVIGRARRGPGLLPVKLDSYEDFVEVFGAPVRGVGTGDIWRDGNLTAPTYAAYAAEAYLRNSSPLTFVRLLGSESDDATASGFANAGWTTTNTSANPVQSSNGGAFGLFVIPSASAGYAANVTGALAAIWYLNEGSLRLAGNGMDGADVGTNGAAVFVENVGSTYEFKAVLEDSSGNVVKNTAFNFNPNSSKYVRKVFNTNPTLANSDITPAESLETYWLGESFEGFLKSVVNENSGSTAGGVYGAVVALENATVNHADFQGVEATPAKTGWVIGQHLDNVTGSYNATEMPKLFRFVVNRGEGSGDWEQNNVKISIQDIKSSTNEYNRYGTFTVVVRKIDDVDQKPGIVEVFTNCNLNPDSVDYIANKIGDKYVTWDKTNKRHRFMGEYDNRSNYVRVEVNSVLAQGGLDPELLPFGFFGPTRFKPVSLVSGSALASTALLRGTGSVPEAPNSDHVATTGISNFSASLLFPSLQLRVSSSDAGVLQPSDTYFGTITQKIGAQKFDEDYRDLVRIKPDGVDSHVAGTSTEYSFVFSLDDVVAVSGSTTNSYWLSGSRAAGSSVTAQATGVTGSTDGYKAILDRGHDRFTMPLFGGFDGLDITEREPFRNSFLSNDGTPDGNYAVYSLRRAIDSVKDPEVVEMNLLTVPGVTHQGTTNHAMDIAKNRADTLAIIDVEGGYTPDTENTLSEELRLGSISSTIDTLKSRAINNSYACTYYPWVKIRDTESGFPLWVPPSVVALGTMASSQERSALWFAPAGFNRGGLTVGSAGLQVVDVREKLFQDDRDDLYEVGINPIASFPGEGIVIMGQKTLQATPSATDRINVRRLLIYLKKEISRIANSILFDQNVQVTWARFTGQAEPVLARVQAGFGLEEYRLVLDETTTTAELRDRNTVYAKIFIKPAKSIEFIGLDFIITRSGASFDDL